MKKYLLSLGLAILLLTSCNPDDELPLTPELVTSVKAYDLDNNGNSSDIRVGFNVRDNLNVFEYRVLIIPSNTSSSFTVNHASGISESSYFDKKPEPFENKYSIKRLPTNLLDVNGEMLRSNFEYVVAVLVVGTGNFQLSEFSKPLTLKDQPIYNGLYFIGYTENWTFFTIPETLGVVQPADGAHLVDIKWDGIQYKGTRICNPNLSFTGCTNGGTIVISQWGKYSFTIEQDVVSNFTWDWTSQTCVGEPLCTSGSPCPLFAEGEGTVEDDLAIKVNLVGGDCTGRATISLDFIRQ